MDTTDSKERRRTAEAIRPRDHPTGHDLIAVEAWLPDSAPTEYEMELGTGRAHRARYWRCLACGAERDSPTAFEATCPGERETTVAVDGGYSIENERTHRALAADLTVEFLTFGPGYRVIEGDDTEYIVDIEAGSCKCDAADGPGNTCEHLRRVDVAIRTGELPGPDGHFVQ